MINYEFEMLKEHLGHKLEMVMYGNENIAIECVDCNEVLYNVDLYESKYENVEDQILLVCIIIQDIKKGEIEMIDNDILKTLKTYYNLYKNTF